MNAYKELVASLFNVNLFGGVKLGLQNSIALDESMGFPSEKFASVHVAGSNGKGSVVTKIAKGLQASGLKVGLYTSPHISCFRERIRINGEMISEESVVAILSRLFDNAKKRGLSPTFFEYTTLLALSYFAEQKVDIAVIETGLGGRLDATNILRPKLCVITSIAFDHTDILGSTLEEIAVEKAGIIKPKTALVTGPKASLEVIANTARLRESPHFHVSGNFSFYDDENRTIAQKALEYLGVDPSSIAIGLEAMPPGRFQEITFNNKKFILDVAHNPDGLERLFSTMALKHPNVPFRIVVGLSKSKDLAGCVATIKNHGVHYHLVEASNGRGASRNEIKALMLNQGIPEDKISLHPTVSHAIETTLDKNEITLVCGTFFIMADARKALNIIEPCDNLDMNERFTLTTIANPLP